MGRFIVRRIIIAAATIIVLSVIVFGVLRVVPGSPCADAEFINVDRCRALESEQGLDKPYFPLSVDVSRDQDWWLLVIAAVPLAFAAGAAYGRRRATQTATSPGSGSPAGR